ncbi:DUF4276 family protein [Crateriforma conspicua]|uniref:DUF4276 domain-containing protein n=1 Tax=Crateriforma conspicua TaxID=2527996 RepID=A0A5C5Y8J7_9PLAN|nr:DUF4276 family protein [Crateriforma conspicua]TWT71514.1 hypothetical protein Pan14r_38240 [Crateriforma conspicua]
MVRLLVHVEGETEETFVAEVLAPHLYGLGGFEMVTPRLLGNARLRSKRRGIKGWDSSREDILKHLKRDREVYSTTMVDYYALPDTGNRAWPGRAEASALPFPQKAPTVQDALLADIANRMGWDNETGRFIPYVMMHEFEGLLFSDCDAFADAIGLEDLASDFQSIRDGFSTPEEINDSPITAPSKRIVGLVPNYQKPFMGNLAAFEIGLDRIREECPLFDGWVASLEDLV